MAESDQPAGVAVDRRVRPLGYLHGDDFIPHGPNGWTGGVPVYDQAALESERAANARLTAELEQAQRQRDLLQAALLEAMRVLAKVDPRGAARWLRDQGFGA